MEQVVAKNSFTFNFNRSPKGFLVALALIFVFETCNAIFDNYFYLTDKRTPPDFWFEGLRIKVKNSYSQKPDKNYEIVVLGDCYNMIGVIPKIIEKNTGLDCYNFSVFAKQTIFVSYLLFDNYLAESEKKPAYLIIGFKPETLSYTKKDIIKYYMPYLFDFKEGNIFVFIKEFGIFQGIKLLFPSLKHQEVLKEFFRNPLNVLERIPGKRQLDNFIKRITTDKGYYARRAKDFYKGDFKVGNSIPNFEISNFTQKYLTKILELSQKNNIKVIYLRPSMPPDVYAIYAERGIAKEYEDFVSDLKTTYEDMVDISPQDVLYNIDMYADNVHLNGKGAQILSKFLSHIINGINNKNLQPHAP